MAPAALQARLPLGMPGALAAFPLRVPLLPGHRASLALAAEQVDETE